MPRLTGRDLVVQWIHSAGTLTVSTTNAPYRSFDFTDAMDSADVSGGNDAARVRKPTLRNMEATLEFIAMGTDGTALLSKFAAGTEGTILWGEEGTATGKPKGGFPAMTSERSQSMSYDGEATWTVGFLSQGGFTFDPAVATW